MIDAVDRLIVERAEMDRGFPGGVMVSIVAHVLLLAGTLIAAWLMPSGPILKIADGIAIALPPGGGGVPSPGPPVTAPPQPETPPETVAPAPPEPPAKILKPPKEEPKKGLPMPDAKKGKPKPTPSPARSGAGAAVPGVPGLQIAPGVPGGTDPLADWYMAGVARKVWLLWSQQMRPSSAQPVAIVFTILSDGSVTDVRIAQSSGISLLDRAAQRAIDTAAPFGPLPKTYGTDRYTVQFIFKPIS